MSSGISFSAACVLAAAVFLLGACASRPPHPAGVVAGVAGSGPRGAALNAVDAAEAVSEALKAKKAVFVAELHDDAAPLAFVAENLNRFHAAGLRLLALESGLRATPDSEGYGFLAFYPWTFAGWKYDAVALAESVNALNRGLPESERLTVIAAEEGFSYPAGGGALAIPGLLNARDEYAAARVAAALADAGVGAKALILYGGAHGYKDDRRGYRRGESPPFTWTPMGRRLAAIYGEGFASFDFASADEASQAALPGFDRKGACAGPILLDRKALEALHGSAPAIRAWKGSAKGYDGLIVSGAPIQGRYFQYVPTEENLRFMVHRLGELESSKVDWEASADTRRFGKRGQYLALLYYVRMYFGDRFDYGFAEHGPGISEALAALSDEAGRFSALLEATVPGEASMREYHRLMAGAGIEKAVADDSPDLSSLSAIASDMERAAALFPADAWPAYWRAWALTKGKRWRAAAAGWENLFRMDSSACLESLPIAFELARECALALGDAEGAARYAASLAVASQASLLAAPMPEFRR